MDFLIYVVVAVVAFYIGWHARGIIFLANISERPDHVIKMLEQIKKLNEEEDSKIDGLDGIEVRMEQVGKMVYAYAKDTNQFIGQGTTLDEALKSACARFPNKKFWHDDSKESSQTA